MMYCKELLNCEGMIKSFWEALHGISGYCFNGFLHFQSPPLFYSLFYSLLFYLATKPQTDILKIYIVLLAICLQVQFK